MSLTWGTKDAYNYTLNKTTELHTSITSSLSPKPPLKPPKMPLSPLSLISPPPKFHLFPSLPPEIRTQIWAQACSQPRTIEVLQSRSGPILSSPYSSAPIPAPLHVSRESRDEALNHYQLAFTNTLTASPGIYVNFTTDTIFFGHRCDFFSLLKSARCGFLRGLNEIRYLAVAALRYREIRNWDFDILKGVQEIVLTAHDGSLELGNGNGREMKLVRGQEVLGLEWEGRWWELPGEVYSTVKALEGVWMRGR